MKNKILKIVPFLIIAILVGVTAVYATSKLVPPGPVANTMYSLTDIYNLSIGETTDIGSGTVATTPSTVVETTIPTLTEVYTAISTELAKLTEDKIAKDVSAFGFTGTLYGDTDPTQVLTTADYPGTAVAGTPAPTFAQVDQTTYTCGLLTTDPAQPAVTLQTICGYHSGDGCSWSGSACTGGTKTPAGGHFTWYAGKASCANSTAESQTVGTWRLPTYLELAKHYLDNNIGGGPPQYFIGVGYWSSTTSPYSSDGAYFVYMGNGNANYDYKYYADYLVHCAH